MVTEKQTSTISSTHASGVSSSSQPNDEMRIAWRYNNLDKIDSEQGGASQTDGKHAYTFDLSQSVDGAALNSLDVTLFGRNECTESNANAIFHNPAYVSLIQKLSDKINESTFDSSGQMTATTTSKNLLRICIDSLGSPLWYDEYFAQDLCLFLSILKAIVRVSLSVCCITAPAHLFRYIVSEKNIFSSLFMVLYSFIVVQINIVLIFFFFFNFSPPKKDSTLIHRVRNLVDYAIELESFAGSDKETNPVFKEYNGLFFIRKMAALNALAAHTPETYDLAFKLRRRRFVIEKLHLPPELQECEQREQDDEPILSAMSCASNKKHLLEF